MTSNLVRRARGRLVVVALLALAGSLPFVPSARANHGCTRVLRGTLVYATGFTVPAGETWCFAARTTTTVLSGGNVVVNGTLRMRPRSAALTHTLTFTGAVESRFVGGGMDPVATDVGLWVTRAGRLNVSGTPKTAWCRCSDDPTWRDGDELRVAPTGRNDFTTFAPFTRGAVVPTVAGRTAEVMNLTRNVIIEGTPVGRSHIFIRSTSPQTIRYATLRHMGPRNSEGFVLGRYGLHFHHAMDGVRGSVVEGVVVRDTGSHAFVSHASHGVTFRDTIAYDVTEDAYWWDFPNKCAGGSACGPTDQHCSNDTVIDRSVAALVRTGNDPYRMAGFAMQCGLRNSLTRSVAVGVQGDVDTSGFGWLEGVVESDWIFTDNVAHNNRRNGIFWWQIDCVEHVVERFDSYRNGGNGIEHGAYLNNVVYRDITSFEDGGRDRDAALWLVASNRTCQPDLRFENFTIDGGNFATNAVHVDRKIGDHAGVTKLRNFTITRYPAQPLVVHEPTMSVNDDFFEIDIECWTVNGNDIAPDHFRVDQMDTRSVLRVQRQDDTAFRIQSSGTAAIPPFAAC